jgi:cytochrome bd-type quinol oxidase subunit 2
VNLFAASQALVDVHQTLAWVVIVTNGLAGLWALAAHRDERLRVKQLWWFTAFAEIAVFVQVALGVVILQDHKGEDYGFHVLYGFSAAFAVGIIYSYRAQLKEKKYLLYGFGGLFIMGLGLRLLTIGQGAI